MKFYSKKHLIYLLILVSFLKLIVTSMIVPIWQTPDEQAHFAQVAYFGEFNKMPKPGKDLNREIFESEILMGTFRDKNGNNKFTYHPDFNIQYSNSKNGIYESQIKNFPKDFRFQLIKQEAANYPPLYYWLAGIFYKISYQLDLVSRVYFARFVSLLLGLGTIYLTWKIGSILFGVNSIYPLTLAILVAFQPMLSFVFAGVSSDNLINLLFTGIILNGLLIIKNGLNQKYLLWSIILIILLYFTKPQFVLSLPILSTSILLYFYSNNRISFLKKISGTILIIIVLIIFTLLAINPSFYSIVEKFYPQSFFPGQSKVNINFVEFLRSTLTRTFRETIPWYWGVYKWLGVVYPIWILRIINRLLFFALIGLLIGFYKIFKNRNKEDFMFIFLIISSLIYSIGIIYYDFLHFKSVGFSFGIQGRYFFPLISAHMSIILISYNSLLFGKLKKYQNILAKGIGIVMILFNLYALNLIAHAYYSFSSFEILINQISQYKPDYFKGFFAFFWLILFLGSLTTFIYEYLAIKPVEKKLK